MIKKKLISPILIFKIIFLITWGKKKLENKSNTKCIWLVTRCETRYFFRCSINLYGVTLVYSFTFMCIKYLTKNLKYIYLTNFKAASRFNNFYIWFSIYSTFPIFTWWYYCIHYSFWPLSNKQLKSGTFKVLASIAGFSHSSSIQIAFTFPILLSIKKKLQKCVIFTLKITNCRSVEKLNFYICKTQCF